MGIQTICPSPVRQSEGKPGGKPASGENEPDYTESNLMEATESVFIWPRPPDRNPLQRRFDYERFAILIAGVYYQAYSLWREDTGSIPSITHETSDIVREILHA